MAISVSFQCTVITPERQVLDTEATFVAFPAHDGEVGILCNRAPLLCKLGTGVLRVEAVSSNQRIFIDGGFAQVLKNRVTILTEQALRAEEIDVRQAQSALSEARAGQGSTLEEMQARRREIARQSAKLKAAR
ncbi:MAG: ATP synthase F1 subunit epsilon [Phycisphaerae bacterium]|nr:ATP synthase F1 subunit epsilon [Phycisphaerae bacterium]